MLKLNQKLQLLFFTIILCGTSTVFAQKKQVSLEEASEMIRHSTQGKVLSAKTSGKNGLQSHRIQVLTPSGRVKIYKVPANNNNKPKDYRRKSTQKNYQFVKPDQSNSKRNTQNQRSEYSNYTRRSQNNENNSYKRNTNQSSNSRRQPNRENTGNYSRKNNRNSSNANSSKNRHKQTSKQKKSRGETKRQ